MPLVTPNKDEEKNSFINRCMSNETMKSEFPDQKQRNAVCFSQWRKKKDFDKMMKKNFIISKSYEIEKKENDNVVKQRFIEIPVSGLDIDRDGEKMSQKAIDSMISRLKSGEVPLHSNHGKEKGYTWQDIMGKSVDAWQEDKLLMAKFLLNDAHEEHEKFWKYLQNKMPVGFSIGAMPKGFHYEEEDEE